MMPVLPGTQTADVAQAQPILRLERGNGDGHRLGSWEDDMGTTGVVYHVREIEDALRKSRRIEGDQAWAHETGGRFMEYLLLGNEIDLTGAHMVFRRNWSPMIDEIMQSELLCQSFVRGAEAYFYRGSREIGADGLRIELARQQKTPVGERLIAFKEKKGEGAFAHKVGRTFTAYIKNLGRIDPYEAQIFFQNLRPFIIEVMQDPGLCQHFVGGLNYMLNRESIPRSYNLDIVERIKKLRKKQINPFERIMRAMNGSDDNSTWAYQAGSLHSFINSIEYVDQISAHILLQRLQPLLEEIRRKPRLLELYAKGLHAKSDPEGIYCVDGDRNNDFEPASLQIETGLPLDLRLRKLRGESGDESWAYEVGKSLITSYLNVDPGIVQPSFYEILPFITEIIDSRINSSEDTPDLCRFFVMGVMMNLDGVAADSPIVERHAEPDILLLERFKRFSGGEWAREVGRTLMYILSRRNINPEIAQRIVSVLRQNIAEILRELKSCPELDLCRQFAVGVHGGTHSDMNAIIFGDCPLERKVEQGRPNNPLVQDVQSPYFLPQANSM
ncbi:MAG: hypothetical protein U9Q67_05135 [Patescibacteria group bacterium]|nr:hypothetical protein [Patescibacteria group bacterium]